MSISMAVDQWRSVSLNWNGFFLVGKKREKKRKRVVKDTPRGRRDERWDFGEI